MRLLKTCLLAVTILAFLSGCGGQKAKSSVDTVTTLEPSVTTAAPTTTLPTTTTKVVGTTAQYCKNVETALNILLGSQQGGTVDAAYRANMKRYATALDGVVSTSPSSVKAYWQDVLLISQNVANGKEDDPSTSAAAGRAFSNTDVISQEITKDCGASLAQKLEEGQGPSSGDDGS